VIPDLTSLSLFLKVVEARSISKAAEQSNIVLSAASRRISQLEDRFGTQLLHRRPGGAEPTLAGEELARHARRVLDDVAQLCIDMSGFESGAKGRVRLHANPSVMAQQLPAQLAAFSREHPEIEVELHEYKSTDVARAVREGAADVGIVTAGVASTDGLHCTPYGPDRMCVVVPRDHPLRARKVKFHEVLQYDLVCIAGSAPLVRLLTDGAARAGRAARSPIQVRGFESACRLIQAGHGIGVMSEGATAMFRGHLSLRLLRLDEPWAERQMVLCTLQEQVPAATRRLLAHLRNRHGC
jgi:DNA-binding transcriptional LysR family regulator